MTGVTPTEGTEAGAGPAGRRWAWLLALVGVLGLGTVLWRGRPVPAEPPSELAANLSLREGRLHRAGAGGPFSGWMLERYPEAALKSRSRVVDGRLNGVSEGWHANGGLQVREHFVAGLSEGPVTKWHPDGTRRSEGTAHGGQLEGVFRRWHENGQLAEELTLRAGLADGLSRAWFPDGSLKAEVTLRAGQVLTQKFWKEGEQPPPTVLAKAGGGR